MHDKIRDERWLGSEIDERAGVPSPPLGGSQVLPL